MSDEEKREFIDMQTQTRDLALDVFVLRVRMVCMMNSAIFCAHPGVETGSLLMAYPSTGISTTQTTESMRMQLRVYLGALIRKEENLLILNDIQFDGIVKGHGCNLAPSLAEFREYRGDPHRHSGRSQGGDHHDLVICAKLKTTPWDRIWHDPVFCGMNTRGPFEHVFRERMMFHQNTKTHTSPEWPEHEKNHKDTGALSGDIPAIFRSGTVTDHRGDEVQTNRGHLGVLDNPDLCDVIYGCVLAFYLDWHCFGSAHMVNAISTFFTNPLIVVVFFLHHLFFRRQRYFDRPTIVRQVGSGGGL